ncbi:hypothetical protein V6O07_15415, partial [Arthrospira platensis SPKY2]
MPPVAGDDVIAALLLADENGLPGVEAALVELEGEGGQAVQVVLDAHLGGMGQELFEGQGQG